MRGILAVGLSAFAVIVSAPSAGAETTENQARSFSETTSVGVHNSYEKATFPYFADALDSGASLLELDLWTNGGGSDWRVSHMNPVVSESNCVGASNASELRSGPRDQGLRGCLADMRAWHEANPEHPPVMIKLELKDGFTAGYGRGPADLDALILGTLGDAVFTPADLMGESYSTPDAAVTERGWPSTSEMTGKFLFALIPGTIEEGNPLDTEWTDRQYATHLRDLSSAGLVELGAAFPAVHRASPGDPRFDRYADSGIRPWFVIFDGDALEYTAGVVDPSWYHERGYLLVMTDAHKVAPQIHGTHASEAEASERLELLAGEHASYITADWSRLPNVLSAVLPRR